MRSPEVEEIAPEEVASEGQPTLNWLRLGTLLGILGIVAVVWPRVFLVILAIAAIIFLHELGHYVTARWTGMKATEFFLGMGPRIWSFRRGETEYGIKAIPAVAYVRIIGMSSLDDVPAEDESRTYRRQGYWQRVLVAGAGSAVHFILAIVMLFSLYVGYGQRSDDNWEVAGPAAGSAAELAGIQEGDRILTVAGEPVATHEEMAAEVRQHPEQTVPIDIERGGEVQTLDVTLGARAVVIGTVGEDVSLAAYDGEVSINSVNPDGVQGSAGLRDGDVVTSLSGVELTGLDDLAAAVDATEDGSLIFDVRRDGADLRFTVDLGSDVEVLEASGFLGVGQDQVPQTLGPVDALTASVGDFGSMVGESVSGITRLFSPSNLASFAGRLFDGSTTDSETTEPTSARETNAQYLEANEARPISIVGVVGLGSQTESLFQLLFFLASINVVIGVINLIPLLPFDGGHIAVATYERIRELVARDGRRYFADANKLMPVAVAVIMVMVTVGLLGLSLDIVDPLQI